MPNVVSSLHPRRSLNAHPFQPSQGSMLKPLRDENSLWHTEHAVNLVEPLDRILLLSALPSGVSLSPRSRPTRSQSTPYTKQDPQLPTTEAKKTHPVYRTVVTKGPCTWRHHIISVDTFCFRLRNTRSDHPAKPEFPKRRENHATWGLPRLRTGRWERSSRCRVLWSCRHACRGVVYIRTVLKRKSHLVGLDPGLDFECWTLTETRA
jgi:hypothetical protein